MSNYDLVSKEAVSHAEVLEVISKKEKDAELTYREDKVRNYLKDFAKLNIKDFKLAEEELLNLEIARLDKEHIVKILDIMPSNGTELRSIVSHSGTVLVDDSVQQILEVLNKYRK